MFKFSFPAEHDRLHARIGFAPPWPDLSPFAEPGVTQNSSPRLMVTPDFRAFDVWHTEGLRSPGETLPVIHMQSGYTRFGVARWGRKSAEVPGGIEFYRPATGTALGNPGLIPASSIELWTSASANLDGRSSIRFCLAGGRKIYLACQCWPNEWGEIAAVSLLVRESESVVALHSDWEPVLVRMSPSPALENWDFLMRRDNGRLQEAPFQVGLMVEPLALEVV